MWRYYVDLYCGIICTKTGRKMNLRATLIGREIFDKTSNIDCMNVK
jgi:hypothetical protein